MSEDGLVWTYKLTPGSGPTASRSRRTTSCSRSTRSSSTRTARWRALGFLVDGISKVEAPDESTVVVTYDKPVAAASDLIGRIAIVPKHIWAPHEGSDGKGLVEFNPGENLPMVSAGPYIPTRYEPRGTSVLEKNPDYPGTVKPHADTIVIQSFTTRTRWRRRCWAASSTTSATCRARPSRPWTARAASGWTRRTASRPSTSG